MNSRIAGVGVALVTLFDADSKLDAAATAALAVQIVDAGIRFVLVAGTTGEAAALSGHERSHLVQAVREALPPDVAVLAGSGAASARQAVELTKHVLDAGADIAVALSPALVTDPRKYYEQVAEVAGPDRLFAYHFPLASAPGIPLDALVELPVAGVKDSSGDISRLYQEVERFPGFIYTGATTLTMVAGALQCAGAMLAIANAYPELAVDAFNGVGEAQTRLFAEGHRLSGGRLESLKSAVAERFGTSTTVRIG